MRIQILAAAIAVAVLAPGSARAQASVGLGGGIAAGPHGGSSSASHATAFLQIKAPSLPGVRADILLVDRASAPHPVGLVVSAVYSAPIPVVTPYVIGGWGGYAGGDKAAYGWSLGGGVRATIKYGFFAEYRRHQRISRDLLTFGMTF